MVFFHIAGILGRLVCNGMLLAPFRGIYVAFAAICLFQAHYPQTRHHKKRLFLVPPVAQVGVAKQALDQPKDVLHFGPDAGLELLHPVCQRDNRVVFLVQSFALN